MSRMSKKDRVKTKLDLLKSLMLGFMTALFGVGGYTFANRNELIYIDYTVIGIVAIILVVLICWCGFSFKKELDKLEKMK